MKRIVSFLIIFNFFSFLACGQQPIEKLDSLRHELSSASNDSTRIFLFILLSGGTRFSDAQASIAYSDSALSLAEKNNRKDIYAIILSLKGATLLEVGKIPESLAAQFESLRISEEVEDSTNIAIILNRIGNTYMELGDYPKAIEYYRHSKDYFVALGATAEYNELSNIGNVYELMGAADSAMYYQQIIMDYVTSDDFIRNGYVTVPEVMFRMGNALKLNRDTIQALQYYKNGITEAYLDNDYRNLTMNNLLLARLYKDLDQRDSSLKYSRAAIEAGRATLFRKGIYESALLLSDLYSDVDSYDSAFAYLSIANTQKDSLIGMSRFRDLQRIILAEQEKQRETEALAIQEKNTIKQYTLLAGLGIFLVIAFLLYYNNRQKQKANVVLKETLSDLKSTQSQLIQSEKMASLGELTAGIAHEIQNPLNFVNNFSELNQELVAEAVEELEKGDIEEAKVILKDIGDNSGKINNHGKRADAIVKGMLQHSRASGDRKEPTDINALAEEYLKLSYHGLRAKDNSFNADFKTDFDPNLPKVNVVPQDIGRVLLNLINNAFQACATEGVEKPTVTVKTQLSTSDQLLITIADNGPGIPDSIKDKIFQPFFTTKPTGQGTGLGLSLSYDIVKAHGGEIKIESTEGKGSVFEIILPIDKN
jgi:signal transduction histidine kinase